MYIFFGFLMRRKQGWDGRKKAEGASHSRVAAVATREVCTRVLC